MDAIQHDDAKEGHDPTFCRIISTGYVIPQRMNHSRKNLNEMLVYPKIDFFTESRCPCRLHRSRGAFQ